MFLVLYRDEALIAAEQQIKSIELKLNSALSSYQSEKEAWEVNLQNVEETWRCKFLTFLSHVYFSVASFSVFEITL